MANLNPLRGFRDLYPKDKGVQDYISQKLRGVADLFGFESYDGPVVEPLEIYTAKTSEELINRQTFKVVGQKDEEMVLRPEMTPSLARMIANKAGELTFPMKLFNLGVRFRYEAPQKGRAREFYQADFDILGNDSLLSDVEILSVAINIFLSLGGTEKDFIVGVNSRKFIQGKLNDLGFEEKQIKEVLSAIDKRDKVEKKDFDKMLKDSNLTEKQIKSVNDLLDKKVNPEDNKYFEELFALLKMYGLDKYCEIDMSVVRGLDYYTGLVFEIKDKGGMTRTLLGGGRYDNLVSDYDKRYQIPGVGFAVSDVMLEEFVKDRDLLPEIITKKTRVLVTVFNEELVIDSVNLLRDFRKNNIPSEIYLGIGVKLDKQLKYADRNQIPYAVIIGPEEVKKGVVKVKDLRSQSQEEVSKDKVVEFLK